MIKASTIPQTLQTTAVIQNPAKNLPQVQNITPASLKNWLAGQVLKGTVLEQLSGTSLLLNIGNSRLIAKTDLMLPVGSQIQLKVIRAGEQPLLQLIGNKSSNSVAETSLNALRQAIPKQASLSELFSNLKTVNAEQRLPQTIQTAVQSLLAGTTSRMDLINPEGIKKALAESGNFLESKLGSSQGHHSGKPTTPGSIEGDLKGQLVRLAALLANENMPALNKNNNQKQNPVNNNLLNLLADNKLMPDLQRHVESGVARIQLNQLNSLPVTEQHLPTFFLELPIKENEKIDILSLKINEEENQEQHQSASKRWSVRLSFDLNGLGKIHAKLILGNEQIMASLWAEQEKTFDLIEGNLNLLQQRLADVKFINPDVKCYKGKPETDISPHSDYNELIDIEI